jgi:hypothetical protein
MKTLTDSSPKVTSLAEVDVKIGRIRQAIATGEASDFARYQLDELLELRRKMVLGQIQLSAA